MNEYSWLYFLMILVGMVLSICLKKLTIPAALLGGALSIAIYSGGGIGGITILGFFFIIGVGVTAWKSKIKQEIGLAETNHNKRTAAQVFANAGLAGVIGSFHYCFPSININAPLLIAACFSSATADTVSSELGNIYGSRFYDILNWEKTVRGDNGVVSVEGTLFGIAGSIFISLLYGLFYKWDSGIAIIILAGVIGNMADSVLGATLERKVLINNNSVNFLNTCIASLFAYMLCFFLPNN